jgi:HAD superfamily hydrolase (TIGR01484 family)
MKPASQFPASAAHRLTGVLFDLDDTLLDRGRLTVGALTALYRLAEAGLILVGVTGRPAGWGQVLVRQWPISGMLTENGIIALVQREHRVHVLDRATVEQRAERRQRLAALVSELRSRFSELLPSDDVAGRIADFSFDIAESRQVDASVVQAATELARERGAHVVRSSIQLHLSYDGDDKASGVLRFLHAAHGVDVSSARHRFAFVGDSENDAPCFGAFEHSFGVANLQGRPSLLPAYRASQPMGAGFAEIADIILAGRNAPPEVARKE